jgi:hypothetical protein
MALSPVPCKWCGASGFVIAHLAYVAGPDPFAGYLDTAARSVQCKHCRGTGSYESALDPTLDRGPSESR